MVRILPAQGATGHFAQDQSMLRRILLTSAVSLAALLHAQAAEVIFRASPSVYEPAPKSVLSASPSALAGVDSDDAAKTVLVTISNRGPAATTVPATPSVSSGPFQIASDGCTGTLAVGASCQIGVRTTQTSVGDVSGSLSIRGLAGGVALSGRVKGPTTCTTVGTACTDGTTYLGTYDGSKWRASYDPAVFTWKTAVPA